MGATGFGASTAEAFAPKRLHTQLLNRARVQTDPAFFEATMGGFAAEMEAARDAASADDLFARLESLDQLRRIDPAVTPTMFRCAIVSDIELAQMRRVRHVVRMGHVRAIEAARIVLDGGSIPASPDQVHVHCCADGIPFIAPRPVFAPGRIALQYMRRCAPCFSAAVIGKIEATLDDDDDKNALCMPVTLPNEPLDWLRMNLQEGRNAAAWRKVPALREWLSASRLNAYTTLVERGMREATPERTAILARYRAAAGPALARMAEFLAHRPEPAPGGGSAHNSTAAIER